MAADNHHRFIPDHAVPLTISRLIQSRTEQVMFGTSDLVRVHTMGVVVRKLEGDCEVEYELTENQNGNKVKVTKMFTSSFTKEHSAKVAVGEFADVFGKVRVSPDNDVFLNAFMIRSASAEEHKCFLASCKLAEKFYTTRTSDLPEGCGTSFPKGHGLKDKSGSLNRFPISMLEESSSVENNLGEWPEDLEKLAVGSVPNNQQENSSDVSDDEPDDEEEEEDSFDAGPPQKRRKSQSPGVLNTNSSEI